MDRQLLSTKQAADWLGIGASTLEKMRVTGGGPVFIKLGRGRKSRVIYAMEDLRAWVAVQRRVNTAHEGGGAPKKAA